MGHEKDAKVMLRSDRLQLANQPGVLGVWIAVAAPRPPCSSKGVDHHQPQVRVLGNEGPQPLDSTVVQSRQGCCE